MGKTINGCPVSSAKQELLSRLGSSWTMQRIDFEPCVYRDLGLYDIEISGGRTKKADINIYVWEKRPRLYVVEQHMGLHYGEDDIKAICDDIVDRLGVETDQTYTEIVYAALDKMELTGEDLRQIKDLARQCQDADNKVDARIRGYMIDHGIKLYKEWWNETDNPDSEISLRTKTYRRDHPEAYVDTEPWMVFQEREEKLKGFIHSLSAGKINDLLRVVRFGKYLDDHPKSIECARAFRDSILGRHSNNEYQKLLVDLESKEMREFISKVIF